MKFYLICLTIFCNFVHAQNDFKFLDKIMLADTLTDNKKEINKLFENVDKNKKEIDRLLNLNFKILVSIYGENHIELSATHMNYANFLFSIGDIKQANVIWNLSDDIVDNHIKNHANDKITDRARNIILANYQIGPDIQSAVGEHKLAAGTAETYLSFFDYDILEVHPNYIFNINRIFNYVQWDNRFSHFIQICNKYEDYYKRCENSELVAVKYQLLELYHKLNQSYLSLGDLNKSELFYKKAYEISEENNFKDHKMGLIAWKLGFNIDLGDKEKADKLMMVLESEFKNKDDDQSKINYYFLNKARYLERFGSNTKAIETRERIVDFYSKIKDKSPNLYKAAVIQLGNSLYDIQRVSDALKQFNLARDIILKYNSKYFSAQNIDLFKKIANCHTMLGKPLKAIRILKDIKVTAELTVHENNYTIFDINDRLGYSYGAFGEYELAAKTYLENIELYESNNLKDESNYLNNLGEAYRYLTLTDKPLRKKDIEKKLLSHIKVNKETNIEYNAEYLNLYINDLIIRNKIKEAESNLEFLTNNYQNNDFIDSIVLFSKARIHQAKGNLALCKKLLMQLEQYKISEISPLVVGGSVYLRNLINTSNELGNDLRGVLQARNNFFSNLKLSAISEMGNNNLINFFSGINRSDSLLISELLRNPDRTDFILNELQKSKGFLSSEHIAKIQSRAKFYDESLKLIEQNYSISKILRENAGLTEDYKVDRDLTKSRQETSMFQNQILLNESMALRKKQDDLDVRINSLHDKLILEQFNKSKIDIKEYLPEDAILIHAYEFNKLDGYKPYQIKAWHDPSITKNLKYIIAVSFLDKDNKVKHIILDTISKDFIDKEINRLLDFFQSKKPNKNKTNNSITKLSKILIDPITDILSKKPKIIFCPIATFNDLPIGILKLKNDYLIKSHSITYVSKISDLSSMESVLTNVNDRYILFGNPNFNQKLKNKNNIQYPINNLQENDATYSHTFRNNLNNANFEPLNYSMQEAQLIKNELGTNAEIYTENSAKEDYFSNKHKKPIPATFVHFSTHAFYSKQFGERKFGNNFNKPFFLETGLALVGAKSISKYAVMDPIDGFFNGIEIAYTNFENTKCVVLNACSTESGNYIYTEGRMSLRKAFQIAGAKSVISTQWPVSDKVASLIMVDFVKNLKRGLVASESIRQAQLKILNTKGYSNPFFWGGYLLYGNGNVRFRNN